MSTLRQLYTSFTHRIIYRRCSMRWGISVLWRDATCGYLANNTSFTIMFVFTPPSVYDLVPGHTKILSFCRVLHGWNRRETRKKMFMQISTFGCRQIHRRYEMPAGILFAVRGTIVFEGLYVNISSGKIVLLVEAFTPKNATRGTPSWRRLRRPPLRFEG